MGTTPRIYGELASWWPLLSSPDDYADEARLLADALDAAADRPAVTLLELGSGGGNNASHLRRRLRLTLVDRSPAMLAVSRDLVPQAEHIAGDMRDVRLHRTFDAVLIYDAVMYLTSEADLRAAMTTAFVHCRPGGAALFAPDFVRETFAPATSVGGHDGTDGRGLRYLEWVLDPVAADTTYEVHYALLLRDADGVTRGTDDHHLLGLFGRADWLRLLCDVGFEPDIHRARSGEHAFEWFVARRPA